MDLSIATRTWQFILPIAPEAVSVQYGGTLVPWTSISQGLIKVPTNGRQPEAVQFKVLLPGQTTLAQLYPETKWLTEQSFVAANDPKKVAIAHGVATDPLVYVDDLRQAIASNKSVVSLLCLELGLQGAYIAEGITAEHSGPFGDVLLSCQFAEYRPLTVSTRSGPGAPVVLPPSVDANPTFQDSQTVAADGTPHLGQPYAVGPSDTLFTIALRLPVNDALGFAQTMWDYDGNAAAITAAGGQQDGDLPQVVIQIPPSP